VGKRNERYASCFTAMQAGFPQMLTRNSLKMSSKFPKFHTNSLDFAQSSV